MGPNSLSKKQAAFLKLLDEGMLWTAEGSLKRPLEHSVIRHDTKSAAVPFGEPELDMALPFGGLPYGALHEIGLSLDSFAGTPNTGGIFNHLHPLLIPSALAINAAQCKEGQKLLLWIGKEIRPTPFLLTQLCSKRGGQSSNLLARCLFITPPDRKLHLWCLETALRSTAVAVVTATLTTTSFSVSRRLTLAAQMGGALGLIIKPAATDQPLSAAFSRWQIAPIRSPAPHPCWKLDLLHCKGPQPAKRSWMIEFITDEYDEKVSLRIPPAMADRSNPQREQG